MKSIIALLQELQTEVLQLEQSIISLNIPRQDKEDILDKIYALSEKIN